MFTGIIRHHGVVDALQVTPSPMLVLRVPGLRARRGDSVAVDGVCLTVTRRTGPATPRGAGPAEPRGAGPRLTFDLLAETLRVTTLGRRRPGDRVNVEPALRVGDTLGGHWVLGHVDGVGRVVRRASSPGGLTLTIAAPAAVRRLLAPKGSIAVDGVSVTVGPRVARGTFTVFLIPHTAAVTTLGTRRPGDLVNLESDPIARYAKHC